MPFKRVPGLCVDCHATARPNKTLCADCAAKRSTRKKKNYRKTSEDGLCVLCKAPARTDRSRCKKCGDRQTRNGRAYRTCVSAEDYATQLAAQDNKCAICLETLKAGPGQSAADHCHKTKKFRGILCRGCNTGIGMLGDNLHKVAAAFDYLLKDGVR